MTAPAPALGVTYGMPAEVYHSIPALSAGGLKRLRQSPLHYWAAQIDPNRVHGEPSPAMKNGTRTHCAALEPHALAERYLIRPPEIDGRTKEGKAWLASVPAGVEVCTAEELGASQAQADSIRRLPEVGALLADGQSEVSAFWIDTLTGELCKCRPDKVSPAGSGVILLDVKTAIDASPAGFAKAVSNWGYHLQAAWYSDGYAMASGLAVLGFVFAVVESSPPYAAAAYMLDDAALDRAREVNMGLRSLYGRCKAANEWPGYLDTIQPLSLPPWAF